ncbi:MAG: hypothetical protein M1281_00065 [Chloroflexi bacterium]|nr:hypothetical protein [Chloroflexota bacterium]
MSVLAKVTGVIILIIGFLVILAGIVVALVGAATIGVGPVSPYLPQTVTPFSVSLILGGAIFIQGLMLFGFGAVVYLVGSIAHNTAGSWKG